MNLSYNLWQIQVRLPRSISSGDDHLCQPFLSPAGGICLLLSPSVMQIYQGTFKCIIFVASPPKIIFSKFSEITIRKMYILPYFKHASSQHLLVIAVFLMTIHPFINSGLFHILYSFRISFSIKPPLITVSSISSISTNKENNERFMNIRFVLKRHLYSWIRKKLKDKRCIRIHPSIKQTVKHWISQDIFWRSMAKIYFCCRWISFRILAV